MVFGALFFGAIGAAVGASLNKIETIVRIRARDADYYFRHDEERPDALRIELSEPLRAIDNARTARASDQDEPAEPAPESMADELGKLASLLQQGLITRDEFDLLKARLIASA
jgi:putative oligomerization/nucleic acid binding protein